MSQAVETVTAEQMVLLYQKAVEERSSDTFANLFAADAVMEFPFVHPGWPHRFVGRDDIRAVIAAHWDAPGEQPATVGRFHNFAWYRTTKPGQVIVEFHLPEDNQSSLLILEVHEGQITLFRQYLNPAA